MTETYERYAQVAVLAQLGQAGGLYTYGVPDELNDALRVGSLVSVPFVRKQLQGIVCELDTSSDLPKVRPVGALLDPVPAITPHLLQLGRWIADYYAAPLSDVMSSMLPPGLDRQTVASYSPALEPDGKRLTAEQSDVLNHIRQSGPTTRDDLAARFPQLDLEPILRSLLRRDLVLRHDNLSPPRVQRKTVTVARAMNAGDNTVRGEKQSQLLDYLKLREEVPVRQVAAEITGGRAALAALAKKGLVEVIEREVPRETDHQVNERAGPPLPLSPAQKEALEPVVEAINRRRPEIFLLHGVTGSGKTEVYLQAMVETIRQGRQAILMVPEISLTPQAMARVSDRFPGRTASLHSKLSDRERVDAWQHIRSGEVDVVVGPRSALFAPVPRPGLIVADEEHDPSYKQNASPRYHARDAAAVLGRLTGATVIFGSATPDVATFEAARSGRIKLLSLPDRPTWGTAEAARPMPRVEIVDMRQELKQGNRSMFSNSLSESLRRTLAADRQSLLFLNRRGNATVVICRDCGYVVRCKSCDIPFTHHLNHSRLICHRCDRRIASPTSCPACGSGRIRFLGAGTQRVEEAARELLPGARVLRWDRDVTGAKGAHQRILDAFAAHQADILVGTQMIAKGLDFPLVTLVGVVSADTGLHMPDFRAPERSFELLTQVAGRAGRAQMPGEVIIQTYTPEHYAIQAARGHDYHRFFEEEMSFRRDAGYPPFSRLLRFVYSDEDEVRCHDAARLLRAALLRAVEENNISADVIGPAPCFIAKIKNRYFWQIIVRGSGGAALHSLLDYVTAGWTVDVDPVDLL